MLISGDLTWKRIRSSIIISCTRPFEGIVSAYSEAATNSHSNIQNFELMEAFLETFESIESEYGKFELSLEENEDPFSSNEIGMPNLSSEIETRWSKWDNHVKAVRFRFDILQSIFI